MRRRLIPRVVSLKQCHLTQVTPERPVNISHPGNYFHANVLMGNKAEGIRMGVTWKGGMKCTQRGKKEKMQPANEI